jgi:serine/threonine-protein kinase
MSEPLGTDQTLPSVSTSASEEPLRVGDVVAGTYELTRVLGRGGMGVVYEASHRRLPGRRTAIKVLLAQTTWSSEVVARFRREAEIASRLAHPHIVEVLDFDSLPSGAPFLVMEYLDGESLAARLRRGPMAVDQALLITRQVAAALDAAHRAGIVHRDLKPDNILLCQRELAGSTTLDAKVLDFGISKIHGSQTVVTQEAVLIGTPQYMAPEQALGNNRELDARTDQFALAAIVYEMLCGQPAFVGESLAQLVFKIVYEPAPPLAARVAGLPPELVAAVERAMRKAPKERFPDVGELVRALCGPSQLPRPLSAAPWALQAPLGSGEAEPLGATMMAAAAVPPSTGAEPPPAPPAAISAGGPGARPAGKGAKSPRRRRSATSSPAEPAASPVSRSGAWRGALLGGGLVLLGVMAGRLARTPSPPSVVEAPGGVGQGMCAPPAPTSSSVAESLLPLPVSRPGRVGLGVEGGPAVAPARPSAGPSKLSPKALAAAGIAVGRPTSPQVVRLMEEARGALAASRPRDAVAVIQRALRYERSSRLYALLVAAYCRAVDLGNARAYIPLVDGRARAGVVATCLRDGVDLRP